MRTQHEVEPYARAWRVRLAAERAEWVRRAEEARALARRAAEILVRDFGARRVYLFGSVTGKTSAPFGPRSDVDLAVEGLPGKRYFEALGALEEIIAQYDFDLVPFEDASASLRRRVLEVGELLCERA